MSIKRGEQVDMFGPVTERVTKYQKHSDTSISAAVQIESSAATLRGDILRAIRGSDGMTDEELQDFLEMNPSTQRPRRIELVEKGLVRDSSRKRKTRSGRTAVVWVACE
jgi:predicted ArsR family transcriptional regulator